MNPKHILFRSEAREKVLRGASLIADAVRVTLGPNQNACSSEGRHRFGELAGSLFEIRVVSRDSRPTFDLRSFAKICG